MSSNDIMFTIASQRFAANIASIAQSLRVIAEEIKEIKKAAQDKSEVK